eukprot:1510729-Rhodomonas_salina.3
MPGSDVQVLCVVRWQSGGLEAVLQAMFRHVSHVGVQVSRIFQERMVVGLSRVPGGRDVASSPVFPGRCDVLEGETGLTWWVAGGWQEQGCLALYNLSLHAENLAKLRECRSSRHHSLPPTAHPRPPKDSFRKKNRLVLPICARRWPTLKSCP